MFDETSVTNHRSAPVTRSCVAIGRETRCPSGRRVVNIAISMPSISAYNSSSFLPVETSLSRSSFLLAMRIPLWIGWLSTRAGDMPVTLRTAITPSSGLA